ncbi:hypothetical protein NC652_014124 [Populus alba x Populus x berolinensis]|nr:hypothetical protein NC652_014124 [Populus alba x Populus x berolinensis]
MQDSPMENHSSKWCCFSLPTDVFDQVIPKVDSVHLQVQDAEDHAQRLNGTPLSACWSKLENEPSSQVSRVGLDEIF